MRIRDYQESPDLLLESLGRVGVMLGGIAFALFVAYWVGTFQIRMLYAIMLTVAAVIAVAVMQNRVWILLVAAWPYAAAGALLPFSVREIFIILSFVAYVAYRIVSQNRVRHPMNVLDLVLWINIAWVVITYLIHPAGFRVFGTATMGGRHFYGVMIALPAYYVIVRLPSVTRTVSRVPLFILAGMAVSNLLVTLKYFAPEAASRVSWLYAMFDVRAYFAQTEFSYGMVMFREYGFLGVLLLQVMCAYFPPLTLLNPLRPRALGFYLSLLMILVSGFRSLFGMVLPYMLIGTWLRRGWQEAAAVAVITLSILALVLIGQGRFFELPMAAQRTLSFLPGKWDPIFIGKGEGLERIDFRFQWWERIIKEKQIKNWWIGDGYAVSAYDFEVFSGAKGSDAAIEWFSLAGGYHSGPLTTIRYVGIVGLLLLYALMITAAIQAVKSVRRSSGTILYPVAIFLAIYTVWKPIHYAAVFGSWQYDVPDIIFYCALVRLITRMLDEGFVPGVKSVRQPAAERVAAQAQLAGR